MFYRLLLIFLIVGQSQLLAQQSKRLKLESYQFSWGGILSSKIPSASYATYSSYVSELFDDTSFVVLSNPYALTTIRLTPNLMGQVYLKNTSTNNLHRFGISFQNRLISSFALTGIQYPNNDSLPLFQDTANVIVKMTHTAPVLNLDYAWLKQVPVTNRFALSIGAGTYIGLSGASRIKGIALLDYWNFPSLGGRRSENKGGLSSFTFNMGLYTSLGFSYCLNAPNAPRQKWYLTYESRFGIDYFAVKNVPSSWLSFQNNQVLGLRYMLAH